MDPSLAVKRISAKLARLLLLMQTVFPESALLLFLIMIGTW